MARKTCKLLNITDEQIEAIQIFINMNEWDQEIRLVVESDDMHEDTKTPSGPVSEVDLIASVSNVDNEDDPTNASGRTKHDQLRDNTLPACGECFLQPCVTHYRQGWLVKLKAAHAKNRITRRRMYCKFWSVMDYRGAWQDPRYIAKKRKELQQAGYISESTVWQTALGQVQREIMPDCVVTMIRGLYPNPPGVPYTGHKWH